jgi:NADPH-dependent 2,4-dienoyl-CoA reductase/sulfur reductase-like enzyme
MSTPDMNTVAIVGTSLAGLRAAETLRQEKFDGRIVMIGAEDRAPYDRPPLSKKVLSGEWDADRVVLRKPDDLAALHLDWKRGAPATALNLDARTITLSSGENVAFDGLIIATGGSVKRLPNQPTWRGVHTLRTLDDSLALREELAEGRRVVVIGAGFIGLEVAATARGRGCDVTVLEGLEAPMIRGLGAEMGRNAALVHEDNGVVLRFGVRVSGLVEGEPGVVAGVALESGEVVPADVVLVGIGVAPSTEWLANSGLTIRDGVVCDRTLNAGTPGVYSAGDVCRWHNDLYGREMRVEHWTTASEQGAAAARNLLAVARGEEPKPFVDVPFFWSDQFTARIQFVGRAEGGENVSIVVGSPEERQFVALYESDGRLVAALGVSRPRQLMPFRKLIGERATIEQALELARSFVAT